MQVKLRMYQHGITYSHYTLDIGHLSDLDS